MGLTVLDAGAVIGFLEVDDPFHEASGAVIRELVSGGEQFLLPASAYAEVLVRPFLLGAREVATVDALLARLQASIVLVDEAVAKAAARLRAVHRSRLRLPDALVIGSAIVQRADQIVTTDARWPAGIGVSVEVLRP